MPPRSQSAYGRAERCSPDLRSEAERLGIAFQTLIGSVLHRYAKGELVDPKAIDLGRFTAKASLNVRICNRIIDRRRGSWFDYCMKGKQIDEVALARVRRAVRQGRVEVSPQDKVREHRRQVDRILHDIGFPEALVTDESCFSDFPLHDEVYALLSHKYGFEVRMDDRIAAIAERLVGL